MKTALLLLPALLLAAPPARAGEEDPARIQELERRIDELERLVRQLAGAPAAAPSAAAPAAPAPLPAKVEERIRTLEEKVEAQGENPLENFHFHGYGEAHYNNPKTQSLVPSNRSLNPETDVHRMVFGFEYAFTDAIRMDFEGEFEHAGGTMEVEYAFLEMDLQPGLSFRAGSVLMPVGPLNETHEPTNFYSVERPYVETYLIPSTWMEIGAGLVGRSKDGRHAFRGYLVTGLTGANFTDDQGIRGGRTKGNQGAADDLAVVARYETSAFPFKGFKMGFSGYRGEVDQANASFDESSTLTIGQADARYRVKNLELLASGVVSRLSNTDMLSSVKKETIGNRQEGWYGEAAYHIPCFRDEATGDDKEFVPFTRFERFDTQASVMGGAIQGRENDRQVWTSGLSFFPTAARNVAIKADIENWRDGLNATGTRFNLGVAFSF